MDFLPHSLSHAIEERGATSKNDILEKIFSYVNIALLHRIKAIFMDTFQIKPCFLRFKHYLSRLKSLISNQNLSTVWELIIFFASVRVFGFFESSVEIINNVTHLFFNVPDNFNFSISCK
jgi:hypothetical protein